LAVQGARGAARPDALQKKPAVQLVQLATLGLPVDEENVPFGQGSGLAVPAAQ
jgi:hypothetical protein